ncbi:MAG: 5-bromo-4-chloroindolyl phosphate hydrolysis family protein [Firmicutes bacterium]|nr:5-bromo-4-chloroindolyl phosphate hydrolysis family protein [Bacillota bacterium]
MTENKTEALKKKLDEEKAEKEAQRLKEERLKEEQAAHEQPRKKAMPGWVPYLVAAVVAFALSLILKDSAINTIICIVLGVAAAFGVEMIRRKQLREIYFPGAEQFSSEIAAKLYELQDLIIDRAKGVKKAEVKESLGNIAGTLNKIADEVEHDPKDRNKVRKLANYYGDMLLGLVDKYIKLQDNKEQAIAGENVENSMDKIEEAIKGAETSVKKLLDSLFTEDAMEINAEINTLDKLMKLEMGKKEEGEDQ